MPENFHKMIKTTSQHVDGDEQKAVMRVGGDI
jgi:hypothetical protein